MKILPNKNFPLYGMHLWKLQQKNMHLIMNDLYTMIVYTYPCITMKVPVFGRMKLQAAAKLKL